MKIETKFDIGDFVTATYEGKMRHGKVHRIIVDGFGSPRYELLCNDPDPSVMRPKIVSLPEFVLTKN